jgi:predicted dehydrogenase
MVRIGVIGGGHGRAVHLPAFSAMPGAKVVAVADGGSGRMKNIDYSAAYFTSWENLIANADIDAVTVAAPPSLHAPIVTAALQRGLHVLCEKPFGRDVAEAVSMAKASAGRVAAVGYQFRYETGLRALRQILAEGRIGRLRRIAITWITSGRADPQRPWGFQHDAEAGGGVAESFFSHCIDYAWWLGLRPVRRVWARSDILVARRPDHTGAAHAVTAEDGIDAVMECDGGLVVTATVTNCQPGRNMHRIEIFGDDGWAELDQQIPAGPHRLTLRSPGMPDTSVTDLPMVTSSGDSRSPAFARLAADFLAAIGGAEVPDLPRFADGVRVRGVLAAVRRSVARGGCEDVMVATL